MRCIDIYNIKSIYLLLCGVLPQNTQSTFKIYFEKLKIMFKKNSNLVNNIFALKANEGCGCDETQNAIEVLSTDIKRLDVLLWDIEQRLNKLEQQARTKSTKKHTITCGNCNDIARGGES